MHPGNLVAEILEDVREDIKSKYKVNLGVIVVSMPIAVHLAALPPFTNYYAQYFGEYLFFATSLLCRTQGDSIGTGD